MCQGAFIITAGIWSYAHLEHMYSFRNDHQGIWLKIFQYFLHGPWTSKLWTCHVIVCQRMPWDCMDRQAWQWSSWGTGLVMNWFISKVSRNCRCLVLIRIYWACEDNSPIRGFIHVQRPEQMGITESLFNLKILVLLVTDMYLGCPKWKPTEAGFVVAWHVILCPHHDEDKWQRERAMISVYKM